ncbi:hypothetical protein R1flu_023840 [Riccia fluitans]|uniref:Ubiquitin-like protease family profile domain-containing protein n=1 Tax=Riccia fluitans TaxID=41844 RepID=A0ABD1XX94_9MARC
MGWMKGDLCALPTSIGVLANRNVVNVAIENAEWRLVLTTVHKALSEWQVDNLLPGTSFITGHRLLASDVDRAGVETLYLSICNDFKLVAASHRNLQLFYKHLKSIFDSYVNPDNNSDVQPLVKGLDAEDFDVDAFLDTNMGGHKEEMTPDFLNGLSVHDVRRLEFEIENIRGEPQWITKATASLRLNYEQDVLPPPTAKENVTNSTVVPTVGCSIDLTADEVVDEPCSPQDRQIISVISSQRMDLTTVVSLEANRCITTEWPRLSDLTKEDLTHLDSFPGIHKEYIFQVLRTFLRLTMPICPKTFVYGTMEVPHQLDQYSCGIHIIQILARAGMKGLGLDQCWRVEKLAWIGTIDQVTTMGIMLSGWLNRKFKHVL